MPQQPGAPQLATLEDYLAAIRDRKLLVLAFAVAFGLLAYLYAGSRTDTFEAQATVVLGPTPVGSDANRLTAPNLERERSVLASETTGRVVSELLAEEVATELLLEDLSVRYIPDSDVLSLTYVSTDPQVAAERVNAFATTYVEIRESESVGYYEDQATLLVASVDASEQEIQTLDGRIEELSLEITRLSAVGSNLETAATATSLATAEADLASTRSFRNEEALRLRELQRALNTIRQSQAARPDAAAVLRLGAVADAPLGISGGQLTAGGVAVGLILGVVTAFLASRLDRSVGSDEGVSQVVAAPVLASVPQLSRRSMRTHGPLVMNSQAKDNVSGLAREEIRRLRSAAAFSLVQRSTSVIVVTSTNPGEGKSTTAANLAIAIAQSGQQTALVSADLRRPTVERLLGAPENAKGLTDWLAGDDDVQIGTSIGVDRLTLVASGPEPANPAELLASSRSSYFFDQLRENFDVVIIDSPPVMAAADVFALVQHADEVLLVVNDRKTELDELGEAVSRLSQVGATILGVVRNGKKPGLSVLRSNKYNYSSGTDRPKLVESSPETASLTTSSS